MKIRAISGFLAIVLLIALAVSCGKKGVPSDGGGQPTTELKLVSGNDQSGRVRQFLSDTLYVRLTSSIGVPIAGEVVNFYQVTPNEGGRFWLIDTLDPLIGQTVTDQNGYAWNRFQTDTIVGPDTLKVTTSRLGDSGAVYFVCTATAGFPRRIEKVSPLRTDGSDTIITDTAGQALSMPFVVRIRDRYGNLVPNGRVVYKTAFRCLVETDSSALLPYELDTAYTYTDIQGQALANWTLTVNPDPGLGFPYGYPNGFPELWVYAMSGDTAKDSTRFRAVATRPPAYTYYNDLRPILIDNCHASACHANISSYRMDFYYELLENGNLVPGDTTSPFAQNLNPIGHKGGDINMVEEDMAARWVVVDSADPGSSGLNNYTDQMKLIFDNNCISCHGGPAPTNNYDVTTHAGIRGNGSDGTPNAIAGDSASILVTHMIARHNISAQMADSITRWVVIDSLRQY